MQAIVLAEAALLSVPRELCVIGYNDISEDAEAARAILKAWKGDRGLAAQLHARPLLHLLHLLRLKLDKLKVLQV